MGTRTLLAPALLLGIFLGAVAQAATAHQYYLIVQGIRQESPQWGGVHRKAPDKLGVLSFSWGAAASPRDAATGQASGKRQYKPLIIVREVDSASPKFLQAFKTNDVLSHVTLEVWGKNSAGKDQLEHSNLLTNATVSKYRTFTDPNKAHGHELEEISFTFQKIAVTNGAGKTAVTDSWQAQ